MQIRHFLSVSTGFWMLLHIFTATVLGDSAIRPVHWWIGQAHNRADGNTAYLVNSWSVGYGGNYRPNLEAKRFHRLVGNHNEMDAAISGLEQNYAQGAKLLATNLEPWNWDVYPRFTPAQAQQFVDTIDGLEDLIVVQWNNFMTWETAARAIIEDHPRLKLVEMVYPTAAPAEPLTTFEEIRDYILWQMVDRYHPDKQPAIGLSLYTSHAMDTPVSWELMKLQIDAAKYVGLEVFGCPNHPIGIFIADVLPTEFTVDDVNEYILGPLGEFTLSYTAGPGGTIAGDTLQSVMQYADGASVRAESEAGAVFTRWSDGITGAERQDVNVTNDITVTAHFSSEAGVPIDWYAGYAIVPEEGASWVDVDHDDSDADGMKNWEEFVTDTNPTNAQSVLRIREFNFTADGVRIKWQGGVQARQFLELSSDFTNSEAWQPVLTNDPPTTVEDEHVDASAAGSGSYFYRIRVERP